MSFFNLANLPMTLCSDKKLQFLSWLALVDHFLELRFAITFDDAGVSEADLQSTWEMGQTPTEYVKWFGQKYGLIARKDWEGRTHPLKTVSR